ncbi:MAG TPA: hypothetical protein VI248_21970 [Kineosporiaceae bacterium]
MTRRDLPPSVPVTTLRVFEPLDAFPPPQRRALAALAGDPAAALRAEEVERRAAWRRVLGRPDADLPVTARVLRVEGSVLLCPVAGEPPSASGSGVVPAVPPAGPRPGPGDPTAASSPGGAAVAAPGGVRPGTTHAGVPFVPPRRHTLVRAWELPMAWLAIVRVEDLTASGGRGRYVLPMARARARAARVLRTLRTHLGELDVTADAEGLARWLEGFHPRSWVEVDARPVAVLVDGEDGADDVRLGLESLTAGEAEAVAAAYQRLRRRSRRLEDLSVSS